MATFSSTVNTMPVCCAGADTAQLVATKAKGLPRITISLHPVATSALKDVIADFSLALYASYKTKQEHASRGGFMSFGLLLLMTNLFWNFVPRLCPQFSFTSFAEQERASQLMESLASERVGYPPPLLIIMLLLDEYNWRKKNQRQITQSAAHLAVRMPSNLGVYSRFA